MSDGGAGSIAHERRGAGPPLVLLHGLGGTRLVWKPQIDRLSATRDVVALDMPGFGDSAALAVRPTPKAMAAAIAAFCRELGIERPHVAGNSLGGWVALEMALAGAASSLCLISPAGLWGRPPAPRRLDPRALARLGRPALLAAARNGRARAAMLRSTVARPERVPAADAAALIGGWIDSPGYEAADAEMRSGIFERPEEIDVPTTIAWGEHDPLVGPPKPHRRPPGSRFVVLEGCGHTPNWDAPERIVELLLEASSDQRDPGGETAAGRGGRRGVREPR